MRLDKINGPLTDLEVRMTVAALADPAIDSNAGTGRVRGWVQGCELWVDVQWSSGKQLQPIRGDFLETLEGERIPAQSSR